MFKILLHIHVRLQSINSSGSDSLRACVCDPRLAHYTHGLENIIRISGQQFWIGYESQSEELSLHPHCPFDYCVSHTVIISLYNEYAYERSCLLCGACKNGYSLVLGTSQCKPCTNSHLTLLIPFAVIGVALVFLLLVSKLTDNRNSQWPSVLCQHCWSQLHHLSTS